VWLSAIGLSLMVFLGPCGHETPCTCGLISFALIGLPIAFFSAGFSTGVLLPGSWHVVRKLLLALSGLLVCFCVFLAVAGTGGGARYGLIYATVCIVGVLLGYGFRRWLISRFIRRSPGAKHNAEPANTLDSVGRSGLQNK